MYVCVFLSVTGSNNATYSAELTDRMRSNTAASPGIRMQIKSPINRMTPENPPERNVNLSVFFF